MTESGYSSGYSSDEFDCDQYFKSELVRFKRSFKVLSLMIKSAMEHYTMESIEQQRIQL